MRGVLILILLALVACAHRQALAPASASAPSVELSDWRLASGKPPTRAEFAALVAACEDRDKGASSGVINHCLADLGLKRTP